MNYLPMKNVYSGVTELSFQSEGERLLDELHEGHPGMARMKAMARMYVWWPGISKDIEETVRGCTEYQRNQSTPPIAIEAFNTASVTSTATIEELRTLFAQFGTTETIVTDNGTCFTSAEFEEVLIK